MPSKSYCLVWFVALSLSVSAQKSFYFASTPTLTPKGDEVIFSYNGNLWRGATEGGGPIK